jgi:hypothetical protein
MAGDVLIRYFYVLQHLFICGRMAVSALWLSTIQHLCSDLCWPALLGAQLAG